jgi:hypothetical protein
VKPPKTPHESAATEDFENMARRLILVAMVTALAAIWPGSGYAATAPAAAPQLAPGSQQYVSPVSITWTPVTTDVTNASQSVYRYPAACMTPTPATAELLVGGLANTIGAFLGPDTPDNGTFCYFIRVAGTPAAVDSPGLTVQIDSAIPTATVEVSGQVSGGVSGTANVIATGDGGVSGLYSSVLHAGGVGGCITNPVISAKWDTTKVANGLYEVCNVVTDGAGNVGIATTTVMVANVLSPAAGGGAGVASLTGTFQGPAIPDTRAPRAPSKLSVVIPRSKVVTQKVRVTLRWVKPTAADLASVVVVLNLRHAPRKPSDGTKVYTGLSTSIGLMMQPGQTAYVALFAYDQSANISPAARRVITLAPLIPLRPLSGAVVTAPPLLSWKAKPGTAYYNVQLYRNGQRVLVGWPSHASYRVPPGKLAPGNYVWYVWPAIKGSAGFGERIGRATFVLSG